ncbi:hypothetical protein ACIPSE_01180 [Streptomyces sp. NPDC090106]|uniref:hypothetical protein n=1 Tax=Streptomyces sp. NPDC090106 TaxID=3365946 RepID=UPI003821C83C
MNQPTVTLADLITTRLEEIADDAWRDHRVMRVNHGDGRVLQIGTGAVWELWVCRANHGPGLCGEPLVTATQAATLTGMPREDGPVRSPKVPPVEIELLDDGVGGFLLDDLFHWSDVVTEFKRVQG